MGIVEQRQGAELAPLRGLGTVIRTVGRVAIGGMAVDAAAQQMPGGAAPPAGLGQHALRGRLEVGLERLAGAERRSGHRRVGKNLRGLRQAAAQPLLELAGPVVAGRPAARRPLPSMPVEQDTREHQQGRDGHGERDRVLAAEPGHRLRRQRHYAEEQPCRVHPSPDRPATFCSGDEA